MENNKQQTAVELMIAEIQRRVAIIQSEPQTMARELMIENLGVDLDTYKEMEKERIETAYNKGTVHGIDYPESALPITGEQYYNETYGGNK